MGNKKLVKILFYLIIKIEEVVIFYALSSRLDYEAD